MERIIERNEISDIASLLIETLTIPIPENFKPDALATLPGLGENQRILQPLKKWKENFGEHFLLAGIYSKEKHFEELNLKRLRQPPYCLQRTLNFHIQLRARHTKEQTDWIANQVTELKISSLFFYAPIYHLTRAYLTLLKSLIQSKTKPIILIPKPIVMPLNTIVPEENVPARSLIPGEIERIKIYQEKGDVATLEELETYLDSILYPFLMGSSLNLG